MKKVFVLFMTLVTIWGCSKDDKEKALESTCQITSMSALGNNYEFEYDTKGRIILTKSRIVEGEYILRREYRFNYQEKVITVEETEDGTLIGRKEYSLENNRIAFSIRFGTDQQVQWKKEYEYNDSNQLSKTTNYDPKSTLGFIATITYENNNIAFLNGKLVRLPNGELLGSYQTFKPQYNLNEARMPFIEFNAEGIFDEWFIGTKEEAVLYEQGFFGKTIKNQLVSESNYGVNLAYDVKDSNNRIVGTTYKKGAYQSKISLIYTCK